MKKENFWITLARWNGAKDLDFKEVTGYTEEFCDEDGRVVKIGVYRRDKEWIATEISTGSAISALHGKTRNEVFNRITAELIHNISIALKRNRNMKYASAKLHEFVSMQ